MLLTKKQRKKQTNRAKTIPRPPTGSGVINKLIIPGVVVVVVEVVEVIVVVDVDVVTVVVDVITGAAVVAVVTDDPANYRQQ